MVGTYNEYRCIGNILLRIFLNDMTGNRVSLANGIIGKYYLHTYHKRRQHKQTFFHS